MKMVDKEREELCLKLLFIYNVRTANRLNMSRKCIEEANRHHYRMDRLLQ